MLMVMPEKHRLHISQGSSILQHVAVIRIRRMYDNHRLIPTFLAAI